MEWSPQIPHMPGAQQPLTHSLILGVQKRLKVWRMWNKAICAGCRYLDMKYIGWVDILDYISTNMDGTLLCGLGSVWKLGRMVLLPSSSFYLTELPE